MSYLIFFYLAALVYCAVIFSPFLKHFKRQRGDDFLGHMLFKDSCILANAENIYACEVKYPRPEELHEVVE
jgi:hypothetical protein